jgi:hypothetical protein
MQTCIALTTRINRDSLLLSLGIVFTLSSSRFKIKQQDYVFFQRFDWLFFFLGWVKKSRILVLLLAERGCTPRYCDIVCTGYDGNDLNISIDGTDKWNKERGKHDRWDLSRTLKHLLPGTGIHKKKMWKSFFVFDIHNTGTAPAPFKNLECPN